MKSKNYKIIDLFSGCGGISLGFSRTGRFDVIGAIDFDQAACKTFAFNFPNAKVIHGDINKIETEEFMNNLDVLVGGPPCQGFSGLNRHNKQLEDDPRNKLFLEFLRFVEELSPKVLLIENVRQILTSKDGSVKQAIIDTLETLGYEVSYGILDSSDFGVPQKRKRAFFVGIKKELGEFNFSQLEKYHKKKVSVLDALSDIERIEIDAKTNPSSPFYVLGKPETEYQKKLRKSKETKLYNHLIYYPTESVISKIRFVPEGGNWKNVPPELFKTQRNNRHSNYLKRLNRLDQSITIDTGHNVYFHYKFDRVPTIRESARIQSFPDNFIFLGTKGQQFRQVGNAVPPLLANAIAKGILEVLDSEK